MSLMSAVGTPLTQQPIQGLLYVKRMHAGILCIEAAAQQSLYHGQYVPNHKTNPSFIPGRLMVRVLLVIVSVKLCMLLRCSRNTDGGVQYIACIQSKSPPKPPWINESVRRNFV